MDDEFCTADFQKRLYGTIYGCQILFKHMTVAGIFFCQEKRKAQNLIKLQFTLCQGQLMVRGGHKDIFFRFLQGLAPAVVIDPPVQKIHDIDGVFVHPVEQYSGRIRYDADGDLRVQPVVFGQKIRENGSADGLDGAEAELAA